MLRTHIFSVSYFAQILPSQTVCKRTEDRNRNRGKGLIGLGSFVFVLEMLKSKWPNNFYEF